jgi:hypothetical protein
MQSNALVITFSDANYLPQVQICEVAAETTGHSTNRGNCSSTLLTSGDLWMRRVQALEKLRPADKELIRADLAPCGSSFRSSIIGMIPHA